MFEKTLKDPRNNSKRVKQKGPTKREWVKLNYSSETYQKVLSPNIVVKIEMRQSSI